MKERSIGTSQTQRQKCNTLLRKVRFSGMEGLARSSITVFALLTPSLPRLFLLTTVRDPWVYIEPEGKVCINTPPRNLESL